MAKQTMGTPSTSLRYRTDNKLYRLQTGQSPIVRSGLYNTLGFDGFVSGTNAIVAVISYTGKYIYIFLCKSLIFISFYAKN